MVFNYSGCLNSEFVILICKRSNHNTTRTASRRSKSPSTGLHIQQAFQNLFMCRSQAPTHLGQLRAPNTLHHWLLGQQTIVETDPHLRGRQEKSNSFHVINRICFFFSSSVCFSPIHIWNMFWFPISSLLVDAAFHAASFVMQVTLFRRFSAALNTPSLGICQSRALGERARDLLIWPLNTI